MQSFRIERDLLGEIEVPAEALYGAQTQRALHNFPVCGQKTIGDYPHLVRALLKIKHAAASANGDLARIPDPQRRAIQHAVDRVVAGELFDQFPIHHLHGGGGTSANMNANEVLANLGEELLGGVRGEYRLLHPNDHVNLNQSTNDVYPTACHLAVIGQWDDTRPAFDQFLDVLATKRAELGALRRLSRTCLQDAVDSTYGDLLDGYTHIIARCRRRLGDAVGCLASVNLGGTIVGRQEDVPPAYRDLVIHALDDLVPGCTITPCKSLFDGAQNLDDLVAVSAQLDLTARTLIKIGNDLRLLGSGPEGGWREIILPAMQPGSSIMPGKINPVIPEFVMQIGFRIVGNHATAGMALDHGELDLNVWESVVVFGILDSMELLDTGLSVLAERCLRDLQVDIERSERNADSIVPLLTRLARRHGHAAISAICSEAAGDIAALRQILRERGLISSGERDE